MIGAARRTVYFNAFTRLTLDGVSLGEMQIGNPRQSYDLADAGEARPEIDITLRGLADRALHDAIYAAPLTGYFETGGGFYYRNCNVANDMDWPDVFYRGRLPHSRLRIRIDSFEPLRIDVQASPTYLRESRSRLTRIPPLDATVSNLALMAAVFRGFVPMHAAAIEGGAPGARWSLLFMGLPNTGKTSTSLALCRALGGDYLAEDICFVDPATLAVFGGPFTLDETKLQNYAELRAVKYRGARLRAVVLLRRSAAPPAARLLPRGDDAIGEFMLEMNRYEFEWNHDPILRHLLIGGAAHGLSSSLLLRRYLEGMRRIAAQVEGIELTGRDPAPWPRLLAEALGR